MPYVRRFSISPTDFNVWGTREALRQQPGGETFASRTDNFWTLSPAYQCVADAGEQETDAKALRDAVHAFERSKLFT